MKIIDLVNRIFDIIIPTLTILSPLLIYYFEQFIKDKRLIKMINKKFNTLKKDAIYEHNCRIYMPSNEVFNSYKIFFIEIEKFQNLVDSKEEELGKKGVSYLNQKISRIRRWNLSTHSNMRNLQFSDNTKLSLIYTKRIKEAYDFLNHTYINEPPFHLSPLLFYQNCLSFHLVHNLIFYFRDY